MKNELKIGDKVWIFDGQAAPREGVIDSWGPQGMSGTVYVRDRYGRKLYYEPFIHSTAEDAASEVRDVIDLLQRWIKNNEQ